MVKRRTETKVPKHATGPMPGTLNLLILKAVSLGAMHGYGILLRIERDLSKGAYAIEQGALYPALDRLVARRWLKGHWQKSANNRKARYYALTPQGLKALKTEIVGWERTVETMGDALECSKAGDHSAARPKKVKAKRTAKAKVAKKTKGKARAKKANRAKKARSAKPAKTAKESHPVTAASAITPGYDPLGGSSSGVDDVAEGNAADEVNS